ncbi:stage II sporulation protein R [Oceanobacillus damuensis]|uniref:stage II sporulation protein R n=1 Tax=Oceanobacillus damuensis TaxID=937928 RepID=UPI00082F570F|nr:stage II sporulation protein R [Oceanobacillus damuensis]
MRKLLFIVLVFFILFLAMPTNGVGKQLSTEADYQVIPDEAIRLRILANSDDEADQELKRMVRDNVNEQVTEWVQHITDIEEARKLIESRIDELEVIVEETIEKAGRDNEYNVEYGKNVTFPTKLYGSFLYPAGEYEAILITIGEGKGANWWCVLFPPLCFLDFFNGTSVAEADTVEDEMETPEEGEETEVKFFLFEWFGWS